MILRDWLKKWEVGKEIYVGGSVRQIADYLGSCGCFKVKPLFQTSNTKMVRVPGIMGDASTLLLIESNTGTTLWALEDGEETVTAACTALKGHYLDDSTTQLALHKVDWTGYWPVINGDMRLTGAWEDADTGSYLIYRNEAAITTADAEDSGWEIDIDEGSAEPQRGLKERVATIFELSDDDWATEDLPRPTASQFLAVLEELKEMYNDRWQKDFKRAVALAKECPNCRGDKSLNCACQSDSYAELLEEEGDDE